MRLTGLILSLFIILSCSSQEKNKQYHLSLSKKEYHDKLQGFWLGQCIANWTGLITEMDKVGNIGEIKTGDFYTREDWGKKDLPNIWGETKDSISHTINFVFKDSNEIWGADDDTDIEYIYQELLFNSDTHILSPQIIRDGWLKHINRKEENFLWVSNQKAFDLMQKGILPPETSHPEINPFSNMIDAQLTTEIFGLYAPGNPDLALQMAELPITTTARNEARSIARFHIVMHSLASCTDKTKSLEDQIKWLSDEARKVLPDSTFPAKMYDYVWQLYQSGITWEQTRDSVYNRYQADQKDGYNVTSKNLHCNGCFAAGINFSAGLISLFYGKGNLKETIKIGTLCGWDSDNPTATWGGLLGFMIGKKGVEKIFERTFSSRFNIHRTRINFPNNGIDNFNNMAKKGIEITNRNIIKVLKGNTNEDNSIWSIPLTF